MKRLLLLLLTTLSLTASAQWKSITGTPQINTSNGAVRWNFGPNGVSIMIKSVDTSRTSGGATFDPATGILSIPRSIGTGNTIYTHDDTLRSNRVVTFNGNNLLFNLTSTAGNSGVSFFGNDGTYGLMNGGIQKNNFNFIMHNAADTDGGYINVSPGTTSSSSAGMGMTTGAGLTKFIGFNITPHNKGFVVTDQVFNVGIQYDTSIDTSKFTSTPLAIPDVQWIKKYVGDRAAGGTPSWSSITGKPTTLPGYGITDAVSSTATQSPNTFLAGPVSGANAAPVFRAINSADIPTLNQNTTGQAGSVANKITFDNSGTGSTSGSWYNGSAAPTISYNTIGAQPALSGTGFVKISGTTITYDNSTYLTTGTATSTYAPLASPSFTGTPTAPTQTAGDNSTKVATTAYTDAAVSATATYFAPGLFTGAGTSGSPYDIGSNHITPSMLYSTSGTPGSGTVYYGDGHWGTAGASYTNGTGIGISSNVISVDQTFAPTWTGSHIFQNNSVGTTITPQVIVANNTVSTSGTTQLLSPALSFRAHGWDTSDTQNDFMQYLEADNYGNYLTFAYALNGGAPSKVFQVSQYGDMTAFGTTSSGSLGISKTGITTAYSTGVLLTSAANSATNGTKVRWSPSTVYQSMVWNTSGTAASNMLEFKNEVRPVSGSSPTGAFYFSTRLSAAGSGSFTDLLSLDNSGNLSMLSGTLQLKSFTVSTLPAGMATGSLAYVTDASSPSYNATLTGGGSVKTMAMYNGTNWVAH